MTLHCLPSYRDFLLGVFLFSLSLVAIIGDANYCQFAMQIKAKLGSTLDLCRHAKSPKVKCVRFSKSSPFPSLASLPLLHCKGIWGLKMRESHARCVRLGRSVYECRILKIEMITGLFNAVCVLCQMPVSSSFF